MTDVPRQRDSADAAYDSSLTPGFKARLDAAIQNADSGAMLELAIEAQEFDSPHSKAVLTVGALLAAKQFGSTEANERLIALGDSYRNAGDADRAAAIYEMANARDRLEDLLRASGLHLSRERQRNADDKESKPEV